MHSLLAQQHSQVHTGTPRRAHMAVSQPAQRRVTGQAAVSLPPRPAPVPSSPHACARALRAPCARLCACARDVSWLRIVLQYNAQPLVAFRSQYTRVYCGTKFSNSQPFCHNTLDCFAIQSQPTSCPFQPAIQ